MTMEQILEIRDGCNSPEQLLKSLAFSRYLKIYKDEYIEELSQRTGKAQFEARQKVNAIRDITARDLLALLDNNRGKVACRA